MSKSQESFYVEDGKESIKPSWKRRSEKFFNDSTFNGMLYIFASKSWIKRLFWAVVILIAIGGFCTITVLNILTLVREPIATSITLTREKELLFPAVTICSLSLLNTTTLESGGETVVNDLISLFNEVQLNSNISGCKFYANRLASNTGRNVSWGELTNLAQNDLSTLLKTCTYEGKKCSTENFEPVSTVAGRCYTFNGPSTKPARTARGTGVRQGLRLELSPEDQLFSLGNDHGFRVVIHNTDELPNPEATGIAVGLNSTVYIGMRQVNSDDKTIFSSGHQCINNRNTDQELAFPEYPSYSPSSCQSECFYRHAIDQCGCIEKMFYTPVSSRYSQLTTCKAPDLCCAVQAFDAVDENCDCPPRCNAVERSLTISSSTHDERMVGVNVFYESLILETRETTDSYTPWSLISDIGGNTGLFLGFTLLSGIELLILVVGLMKDCCSGCKRQKA